MRPFDVNVLMSEDKEFFLELESFVDAAVHVGEWSAAPAKLSAKLDILERVVELLRLRTGSLS